MSEINTGIRSILKYGWVYRFTQLFLFNEKRSKAFVINNYLADATDRSIVLDMGCGAGNFAYFMPERLSYIGFDPNELYIKEAQKKFQDNQNIRFYLGTASSDELASKLINGSVDYAIIHGVLHHLSDSQIQDMYEMAGRVLKPGGKLVILEPVWFEGQSLLHRLVMSFDRGKNIKTETDWLQITNKCSMLWGKSESIIRQDLIRFYDLIVICVSKKRLV